MTNEEKIAALEREMAELKAKVNPPEPKPFVPAPYQRYDPTEGMRMPPSALRAMVDAVPDRMLRDIVRDNRGAPTGPTTMNPSSQRGGPVNVPGSGTGWAREIPLGPPPGVAQADRLMDAQDAKDRAALIEREAQFKAMEKIAEQTEAMAERTEALRKLAESK
jgi:hypothetical protein